MKLNDVNPELLIKELANILETKKIIEMPEWALYVKTGAHVERPPIQKNWWYIRAASILRTIAINGPVGVGSLRIKYGSSKNRGVAPNKFVKAGGKIIRVILQQLEKAGLVEQKKDGFYKGRVLTKEGFKLLKEISDNLS